MSVVYIDRTVDQTVQHFHVQGKPCPACDKAEGENYARPMPAVIENQRIKELELENQRLRGELDVAEHKAAKALERIAQFEKLTESLANGVDRYMLEADKLLGARQ